MTHLRLYLHRDSAEAGGVDDLVHEVLRQCIEGPFELEIIDVGRHPERARADGVWITPTLVADAKGLEPAANDPPGGSQGRRVIGDFHDGPALSRALSVATGEGRG